MKTRGQRKERKKYENKGENKGTKKEMHKDKEKPKREKKIYGLRRHDRKDKIIKKRRMEERKTNKMITQNEKTRNHKKDKRTER